MRRILLTTGLGLLAALAGQDGAAAFGPVPPPAGGLAGLAAAGGSPRTPISECSADLPHEKSAAVYRICTPPDWWVSNQELVIWAHGYVDFTQPIAIPEDQLCFTEDLCINDIVNFLGYDFATTSYAENGLAVLPGMADIAELIDLYTAYVGRPPLRVYLIGASEGGLITALSLEQRPDLFDGGLALCGPIGDFRYQTNYFGDFRAIFDHYFPGLIPGDPTQIPPELIEMWDTYYPQEVYPVVFDPANADKLRQLVAASGAPYDPHDRQATMEVSVGDLTWYSVFATNDATEKLGGQPYSNKDRIYTGSDNDWTLNTLIQRIRAEGEALGEMRKYQTTGVLANPLVTLHTTWDQQVPHEHEVRYLQKTTASGAFPATHFVWPPTQTYGHCFFAVEDVIGAFRKLVEMVTGAPLPPAPTADLLARLPAERRMAAAHSYRPRGQ